MTDDKRRAALWRRIPGFRRKNPPAMVLALTWIGAAALLMTRHLWWGLAMAALPFLLFAVTGAGLTGRLHRRVLAALAAAALVLAAMGGGLAQARQAAPPLPLSAATIAQKTTPAAETATTAAAPTTAKPIEGVGFVASRQGEVFHLPDCASAKRIKLENLVAYSSLEDAEAAGLRPCKKCKPDGGIDCSPQPSETQTTGGTS